MPTPSAEDATEPFSGIKEIVLDASGNPKAIPRRPPPVAAATPRDEIAALVENPLFAFGVVATLGSFLLLFAIAAADDAACDICKKLH